MQYRSHLTLFMCVCLVASACVGLASGAASPAVGETAIAAERAERGAAGTATERAEAPGVIERSRAVAQRFESEDFVLTAENSNRIVDDGVLIGVGETHGLLLLPGDVITPGSYWSPLGSVATYDTATGEVDVLDSGVVIVASDDDLASARRSASTKCGPGFYACCGVDNKERVRANCIPNDESPPFTCLAGGPGSPECDYVLPAESTVYYDARP